MSNSFKDMNIILGIDPGSTLIGYGVIGYSKLNKSNKPVSVGYGYIDLKSFKSPEVKLLNLYKDLKELISKYKPKSIAVESLFFFKNAKTVTQVLQSRGVILLAAAQAGLDVSEYTPLQVKQTISGYGKADKNLVKKLVQSTLDIKKNITPDDVSDALAIAICHLRYLTVS